MGTPGENNPLWSSGQGYQYPQCNRQTTNAWPVEEPHCSYRPYPAQSSAEMGLNPSNGAEAANCIVYQQPMEYGHSPTAPSANLPIEEGEPFPPAEVPVTNQHMSPDGGYSSSASVGSEYFGPFPQQPQAYAMSPYQNMVPSVEAGIKYEDLEVPVKQEQQDPFRSEEVPVTYTQQLDYFMQTADDNKAIIHENILLRAPDGHAFVQQDAQNHLQAQIQMQTMQLNLQQQQQQLLHQQQQFHHQQQQQHQLHQQQAFMQQQAELHAQQNNQQQTQEQAQQQVQEETQQEAQPKQPRKVRKHTHPVTVVVDDQQPSTSTAPIPVINVPAESPEPAETVRPAAPRHSRASPVDLDPSRRRSARPSVVEVSNFPCDICGEFFARQCGLTQHKKWIHSVRKLPCERCGKKFPTQQDLEKHIARHDMEDKPFKCDICPKQFCHKNDLKRHRYRHDDTAPFVCTLCAKSFIRQDHLVAHLLSHERRQQALENGKLQEQQEKQEKEQQKQQSKAEE